MTLSDATILARSGLKSDGNKGVLRIPQSSGITGASPSHCLVSYPGHLLGKSYLFCRNAVSVFCSLCRLGQPLVK